MNFRQPVTALSIAVGAAAALAPGSAAAAEVRPLDPPALAVEVAAPGGGPATRLEVAPPELRDGRASGPVPDDYVPAWDNWRIWPTRARGGARPPALSLSPDKDERGTPILGALFRSIPRDSVRVASADGARTFAMDRDYRFNDDWGQVANLDGRLGAPGAGALEVTFRYATQRLDLVQRDRAGRVSIRRGAPAMVCPELPAPDEGATPLAGIYVAPWQRGGAYAVTADDLFPIDPAPPVAPVRPEALARARAKLAAGGELKVAFLGDSITLGAEAGAWWDALWTERNLGYPSRVVVELRRRYPKATVTPIAAFQGGITTQKGLAFFDERVAPAGADVLVVAFGLNDADGPNGGGPKNPPAAYREQVRAIVKKARGLGMEVMLVSPMQPNPFLGNGIAGRVPAYRDALLAVAAEEDAGCADVYTEWMNQARRGVPPFSQLHNWVNHPGAAGHALYAGVVLRFF